MKRTVFAAAILLICLTAGSPLAEADSLQDAITYCIGVARVSQEFGDDRLGEASACATEIVVYLAQQAALLVPFVGQAEFDGAQVNLLPGGTSASLSLQFIDPATGLPASGPLVGFVDYQVNLDPSMPNLFLDLGTSSNAGSNFALPFTIPSHGEEPIVLAFPFSPNGNPIFIAGTGGFNDAVGLAFNATTPEPPEVALLGSVLIILSVVFRREFTEQ